MNIFEQMEAAHVMLVNGVLTTNFGWNPDDEPEDWCLSVYGNPDDGTGSFEHYFAWDDMNNATAFGDRWVMTEDVIIEFCALLNVTELDTIAGDAGYSRITP